VGVRHGTISRHLKRDTMCTLDQCAPSRRRVYGLPKGDNKMNSRFSRRKLIEAAGVAAFAAPAVHAAKMPEPRFEGKDTPKLALGMGDGGGGGAPGSNEAGLKRIKQIGVDYVLGGGPRIP